MDAINKKEPWIALDAMGGDDAPAQIVQGAVLAASRGIKVILVGDETAIRNELGESGGDRIRILHASEQIEMGEHPARAIKQKPDNSLVRALELCRDGKAQAILSAGNSGALMVGAKWVLGDSHGIFRPAIATPIPNPSGEAVMLDAGVSTDCSPENLFQFGLMGHLYAKHVLKIDKPRVSLLNIGEERTKGNNASQKAYEFLDESNLNFNGNIEGDELFDGKTDVIVCDGFVGNITLKVMEGTVKGVVILLKDRVSKDGILSKVGLMLIRNSMRSLRAQIDWREYGGAIILGVKGNVIITHGKANASTIANALKLANRVAIADLAGAITSEMNLTETKSPVIEGSI